MIFALFSFASCSNSHAECISCVDIDADGICDACGEKIENNECQICVDTDSDGKCDACGSDMPVLNRELLLLGDGKINFSFIISTDLSYQVVKRVDDLIARLATLGYTTHRITDGEKDTDDKGIKVLVGTNIECLGSEYKYNGYLLGESGYTIQMKNQNVIISGGSAESILTAMTYFEVNVLSIDSDTATLSSATFDKSLETTVEQNNFEISSIKIGDRLLDSEYVIAYDTQSHENYTFSKNLQLLIYSRSGIWLEITGAANCPSDKYISIVTAEKSGGEGFEINVVNGNLEIMSEFPNKTLEIGTEYFDTRLYAESGEATLEPIKVDVRYINYEQFGAYGDGITDDFEAIKATHTYANKYGHTVVVNPQKTYYIGRHCETIQICYDVYWNDAKFIIDDRYIASTDIAKDYSVFEVSNLWGGYYLSPENEFIKALNANKTNGVAIDSKNITKLEIGLGYPALLTVTNENHKNYIRYGANQNSGAKQTEVILIDKDGNIDKDTPFMFDYETVTSISAISVDQPELIIYGGEFTQRANQAKSDYKYYSRNIVISRSNATIKNLTYKITDERTGRYEGDPYAAFLSVMSANNVLIEGCTLQAHKTYYSKGSGGSEVGMGSYAISATYANRVIWKDCVQSNFFKSDGVTPSTGYWGIMGSSYSKNLEYNNSILSRFDAHAGVYNARIINSSLSMFRIVGSGELLFENSHMYGNLLIGLREDYGAFWHGNVKIKNVTMHNSSDVNLISGTWYNHDFGYETAHPTEIEIDGLILTNARKVNVFDSSFVSQTTKITADTVSGKPNVNKTTPTKKIIIKNNANGYNFILPDKTRYPFFANTEYVVN